MGRKILIFLIPFFSFNLIYSQNLIVNHGFEDVVKSVQNDSFAKLSEINGFYWITEKKELDRSWNHVIVSKGKTVSFCNLSPKSGDFHLELKHFGKPKSFLTSEPAFLAFELKQPLIKDCKYVFKVYINLAIKSDILNEKIPHGLLAFGITKNNLKTYITSTKDRYIIKDDYKNKFVYKKHHLKPKHKFNKWQLLSDTIIAKGYEKYLILGNYKSIDVYITIAIDDLSLEELPFEPNISKMQVGEKLSIPNIVFDVNSYKIKQESNKNLDKLYSLLKENVKLKIEISGHTDNIGKDADNLILSTNRAKAIVDYLIKKGINSNRLAYKGYGSTQPIADNKTYDGRAQNRRVEIIILEK